MHVDYYNSVELNKNRMNSESCKKKYNSKMKKEYNSKHYGNICIQKSYHVSRLNEAWVQRIICSAVKTALVESLETLRMNCKVTDVTIRFHPGDQTKS